MTKQDVIETFENLQKQGVISAENVEYIKKAVDQTKEPAKDSGWDWVMLLLMLAFLNKPTWISTKDRLPEDGERVLIYTKYEDIIVAKYYSLRGVWRSPEDVEEEYTNNEVTHWMPLPKPPVKNMDWMMQNCCCFGEGNNDA